MGGKTRTLAGILSCALLFWFLLDPDTVRTAVSEGLHQCAASVIPALYPFLTVSGLLMTLYPGGRPSGPLCRLLEKIAHTDGTGADALVLGILGGYPIGAKAVATRYAAGDLSREEADRLLTFVNCANPATFFTALGSGVFHSVSLGACLWGIHLLSALLSGALLCRRPAASSRHGAPMRTACSARGACAAHGDCSGASRPVPPAAAFTGAVRSATGNMLHICGFVTLFRVLVEPLTRLPGLAAPLLAGAVEQFSCLPLIPDTAGGFVLLSGLAGWGGLSVLCQIMAVLEPEGLSIRPCLQGKLLQSLFSLLLAALVSPALSV